MIPFGSGEFPAEVYLKAYASVLEAQRGLEDYFRFYNGLRPHQSLGYRTPAEVFHGKQDVVEGDSIGRRGSPEQGTQSLAAEPGFSLSSALILSKYGVPPQPTQ
ncbi:MAG: transposase [Chloroflexi bacterium]|nr:transposase [Chloroflexota bacterium]